MEKVIYISTLAGKKPVFEVNSKTLGKIASSFGGLFFHRSEDGRHFIKPISSSMATHMVRIVGSESFIYIEHE